MEGLSHFIIIACTLQSVLSDGYPKEAPNKPFNTGTPGGAQDSHPPGGSGGYPPLSTDYTSRYRGPVAMPMVLPDGHISDTPEVSTARAAHLALLDKAKALWNMQGAGGSQSAAGAHHGDQGNGGAPSGAQGYSYPQGGSGGGSSGGVDLSQSYGVPQEGTATHDGQGYGQSSSSATGDSSNMPYEGPLAMLTVLPSGFLADTPEIAALRAAHLSALLKKQSDWKPQH